MEVALKNQTQRYRTDSEAPADINVAKSERWASAILGGGLAIYGIKRGSLGGLLITAVGGALAYRGVTGHCNVYGAFGINTATRSETAVKHYPAKRAIKVEHSVAVDRPAAELYQFWRNFENLPKVMDHLESVTCMGDALSHWVAKGPAGTKIEWGAEIINERENELIAWQSLKDADIGNAGSVTFRPLSENSTDVRIAFQYEAPAGRVGVAIAKLLGEEPEQQVKDDLLKFKNLMERRSPAMAESGTNRIRKL